MLTSGDHMNYFYLPLTSFLTYMGIPPGLLGRFNLPRDIFPLQGFTQAMRNDILKEASREDLNG